MLSPAGGYLMLLVMQRQCHLQMKKPFTVASIQWYVPATSIDAYKATSPWSKFSIILAIENTAINNTNRQNKVNSPIWHSLDGRRIKYPSKGVYINNGRKILIAH